MRTSRQHLQCWEIMHRGFPTCRPEEPVGEAASRIGEEAVPVVVVDEQGEVAGVLHSVQVERAWLTEDRTPARQVMSGDWIHCDVRDDARHVGARLLNAEASVAVALEEGHPAGLLTLAILGRALRRSRHSHHRAPRRRREEPPG